MPDAEAHGALAVASRRRLLELLRAADGLDVAALAAATGQHTTTVRFHLAVLARTGLVSEHVERRATRGRPRTVYTATTTVDIDTSRSALAEALVSHLDHAGQSALAEQAGRAWARRLTPQRSTSADLGTATQTLLAAFTEIGFAPQPVPQLVGWRIDLRACPFRGLAVQHPDVVCTLHLGMLRELLEQGAAGAVEASLTPFVGPDLCVVELVETGSASAA